MLTNKFYEILDKELESILAANPADKTLHRHKKDAQNKGYAFPVWFLDFYGQAKSYKNYITDGTDDASCDIIFSNKDTQGQVIFYVVQSKWINFSKKGKKEYPSIKKEEFNAVLTDFDTVIQGNKQEGSNQRFNERYRELIQHLQNNGKAKFIFFTAAQYNENIQDNIVTFRGKHGPNITFEIIDIHRIKRDYIEYHYKGIRTTNPLEYQYDPEEGEIEIELERFKSDGDPDKAPLERRDFLQFEGRAQAYILLLRPGTVHDLFEKYRFALFFKNVRNPLLQSNYNHQIVATLLHKPDSFWYFNNGITAITKLIPTIGNQAKKITITGLQVINGAQTVYAIYQAYQQATAQQKKVMDADARITFRLIRSSDEDFNMEITRYTNQQNPMHDEDFIANDAMQQRLQNESFKTGYWYEKRRGEFRGIKENNLEKELGIYITPNTEFATAYVAFHLQRPVDARNKKNKFFISQRENKGGLYESIFEGATFEDMYCSFLVYKIMPPGMATFMPILSLSKIVLQMYLNQKYQTQSYNERLFIIESEYQEQNEIIIGKILSFCSNFLLQESTDLDSLQTHLDDLNNSSLYYEKLTDNLKKRGITIGEIDQIDHKSVYDLEYYPINE